MPRLASSTTGREICASLARIPANRSQPSYLSLSPKQLRLTNEQNPRENPEEGKKRGMGKPSLSTRATFGNVPPNEERSIGSTIPRSNKEPGYLRRDEGILYLRNGSRICFQRGEKKRKQNDDGSRKGNREETDPRPSPSAIHAASRRHTTNSRLNHNSTLIIF